jgi:hypothetical protein
MVILSQTAVYITTFIIWNGGSRQQQKGQEKLLEQARVVSFILLEASGSFNKTLAEAAEWSSLQVENDTFA